MRYLLNSQEMKYCDSQTSSHFKVPSICLMEQAALAALEEIKTCTQSVQPVLVVCGSGNNGGDGLAIARLLYLDGYHVTICFAGQISHATEQTKTQLEIIRQYGIEIKTDRHEINFSAYDIIVDALFGVGLNREITGEYAQIISCINKQHASIISIDMPSGINSDNGQIEGIAVKADRTITFAFEKRGMYLFPGADYTGTVICKQIGITEHSFLSMKPKVRIYERTDLKKLMPSRHTHSNKGSYGKVTLITGSYAMAGAAYLSALAAYRSGCGLVRIVTPEENRIILQSLVPEAVLTVYDSHNPDLSAIMKALDWADVIGIGCGLGQNECAKQLLDLVCQTVKKPIVADADALNLFAMHPHLISTCQGELVLTPHLGEMARLLAEPIQSWCGDLLQTASNYATTNNLTCVLKDAHTIIADCTGELYLNLTGSHGMATGGSGDILTGLICGLIASGLSPVNAAVTGVLLHGMTGEEAAREKGPYSMTARDIIDGISTVLRRECDETL